MMLTATEISARTARAVTAATAAGQHLGLQVKDPRVLHDVFSVVVHLSPSPVVVRVPTVLPTSYASAPEIQTAQQRSELAVTGWLADHGHPVVPPSPLVPREPVARDGFSMTFWQFVEEVPGGEPADLPTRVAQIARMHAALRSYPGDDLGLWAPFGTYIPAGLSALQHLPDLLAPADLQRAQREWEVIAPVLTSHAQFASTFPGVDLQPIHGDAPYANMINTPHGELWSDFELVTWGAVESDLALVGPAGVAAYDTAAASLGLRPVHAGVLQVTEAAARLGMIAALSMAPELPMLVDALRPMINQWRESPPITAIEGSP